MTGVYVVVMLLYYFSLFLCSTSYHFLFGLTGDLPDLTALESRQICPTFANYRFRDLRQVRNPRSYVHKVLSLVHIFIDYFVCLCLPFYYYYYYSGLHSGFFFWGEGETFF